MFGGGTEAFRLYGTAGMDPKPAMQGIDQLSGHVQKSSGIIQGAMSTALGFLGGQYMTRAIDAGVGFLKGAAIDYNAAMEQATIGFTTLLGSAEKAKDFIGELETFAATTPFDFPGLQSAANQMLAMGFSSEEVVPKLKAVGDAVAALGGTPDMVNRAVYALGQMKSAGRVTAQDMMQLTSMGIPAWKLLADSMGVTVQKAREMSEKGLIPAEQAITAITEGIEKSPMGDMMQAQSRTFVGAMSNITDTLNMAAGKALQPFFEMVSATALAFADWLGSDEGEAFFAGLSDAIGGAIKAIKGFLGPMIDLGKRALPPVIQGIGMAVRGVQGLLKVLDPLIQAAMAVVSAVGNLAGVFMDAGAGSSEFDEALGLLGDNILGYIRTWIATIPPLLASLAEQFVAWIGPMIPPLLEQLGQLALALLNWVVSMIPPLLAEVAKWAGAFIDWIGPMIPVFLEELLRFIEGAVDWLATTGIPEFVKAMAKFAQELVAWVGPQIPVLLGKLGDLMVSVGGWIITQGIPRLFQAALKLGAALVSGFIDLVMGKGGQPGVLASFTTFLTRDLVPGIIALGGKLLTAAIQLGGRIVKGVVDGLASLPGKIWNAVVQAFRSLKIDIGPFHITSSGISVDLPKFATGSWNIPRTGPAIVHQGEMIIPADVASRLRRFGGLIGGGAAPAPAMAGNVSNVVVNIGTFYGTQANIDALSRSLAERARYAKVG